jgi:hypothetical protein
MLTFARKTTGSLAAVTLILKWCVLAAAEQPALFI